MLLYSKLFFSFRKFVTVFLFVARDQCPFYSFVSQFLLETIHVIHHFINLLFSGIEFYNGDVTLPIWKSRSSVPVNTKDAVNIIISNSPSEKICRAVPVYVKHSVAFLVDTSALIDWRDIRTDLVGDLARCGTKSFYFYFEKENHTINTSEDDATHVAKRYTYKHKSYPDFHKVVILSENGSCSPFNLFYVQYYFEGGEKDISFSYTHGNSKRDEPFKATTYSV